MDSLSEKVTIVNRENNHSNLYLLYIRQMTFVKWLDKELKKRNWTRNELARRAGISDVSLTLIYGGKRKPGVDVCSAIASALKISPEVVFRYAGLLPEVPDADIMTQKALYLFGHLDKNDQERIIAEMEWIADRKPGEIKDANRK